MNKIKKYLAQYVNRLVELWSIGSLVIDQQFKIVELYKIDKTKLGFSNKSINTNFIDYLNIHDAERLNKMIMKDEDEIIINAVNINFSTTVFKGDLIILKTGDGNYLVVIPGYSRHSRENFQKLYKAIEQIQDHVFVTDKFGKIEYANPAFRRLTGFSNDEIIGKTSGDLVKSGFHSDEFYSNLKEKLKSGECFTEVFINRKKNGEIYYTEEYISSIKNSKGEITNYISTGRDITEKINIEKERENRRKELEGLVQERTKELTLANKKLQNQILEYEFMEEELRFSDERFNLAADASNQGLFDFNFTEDTVFFDERFENLLGYGLAGVEINLINWRTFVYPGDLPRLIETVKEHMFNKTDSFVSEVRLRTIDNDWKWCLVKAKTIGLASFDRPSRIIGTVQDISVRKKMEDELIKALEREKELSKIKTDFVSMVSHEFRTPLSTIQSSAGLLELFAGEWSQKELEEHTTKIEKSIKHLTNILDDVLTINKVESGKIEIEKENMDLVEICEDILRDVKDEYIISPEIKFKHGLNSFSINSDRKLVRYIFGNLLSNAIKYTSKEKKVDISLERDGDYFTITFADEGIGIKDKDKTKIFDAFVRGTNVSNIHGTGLGLMIVKKAVDLLHGKLEFYSEENKGSKFIVNLPVN